VLILSELHIVLKLAFELLTLHIGLLALIVQELLLLESKLLHLLRGLIELPLQL